VQGDRRELLWGLEKHAFHIGGIMGKIVKFQKPTEEELLAAYDRGVEDGKEHVFNSLCLVQELFKGMTEVLKKQNGQG